jgi:hypothetical protein
MIMAVKDPGQHSTLRTCSSAFAIRILLRRTVFLDRRRISLKLVGKYCLRDIPRPLNLGFVPLDCFEAVVRVYPRVMYSWHDYY